MSRHLKSCLSKNPPKGKPKPGYMVTVTGAHAPAYWMHMAIRADATFEDLDCFLRDIWLECCGHISQFSIGEWDLVSHGPTGDPDEGVDWQGPSEQDMLITALERLGVPKSQIESGLAALPPPRRETHMGVPVADLLKPKLNFRHEYDFGSTTALKLRVVCEIEMAFGRYGIVLLARNEPPEIPCEDCGKLATRVCCECLWDGRGWVCAKCAPNHECGDEMLLPVVNSPRVGVCGFTGGYDPDQ